MPPDSRSTTNWIVPSAFEYNCSIRKRWNEARHVADARSSIAVTKSFCNEFHWRTPRFALRYSPAG